MPATKRLTLYNSVDSPYPHRVRLALEEAGAKYDIIWINLLSKPEWYKKVYSHAKVPFLVYGGPALHEGEVPSPEAETISESMVILEFLVDLFPEAHLLPTEPVQRAKARFFIKTTEEKFCKVFFSFIFLGGEVDSMLAAVEEMQALLPDAGFAVGRWSIADAAFVPFLLRLDRSLRNNVGVFAAGVAKKTLNALYEPKFSRIRRYLEDNLARDSMIKTWNEPAVMAQMERRLDRMRRTGVINADLSVPVPKQ
ncbi:thioredoxin-like protein [Polyporus arcularius HHB13444]|uniref:Thioredoxin-like protein n=1 Tax=Polyporus arcularius HHB13444 TaxID=1314778 RepID=A0A5C3P789_9APHY|nr:thioredoxin-like protein [Polyporus arcularius HHB13444]